MRLAATSVSVPYQMPEASIIGTNAGMLFRPATPANGGITARAPGMKRLKKMPQIPCFRYSRSIRAIASGLRSRVPNLPVNRDRPTVLAAMYTAAADVTFAVQVTAKTAHAETEPYLERKAPTTTAVSAGTGGNIFSALASIPMVA